MPLLDFVSIYLHFDSIYPNSTILFTILLHPSEFISGRVYFTLSNNNQFRWLAEQTFDMGYREN